MISTFGKVAINGAQQKLNDKLVEEEERLWQGKLLLLICGQIKGLQLVKFDLWANFFSRFAPLPLQICDQGEDSRGIKQHEKQKG